MSRTNDQQGQFGRPRGRRPQETDCNQFVVALGAPLVVVVVVVVVVEVQKAKESVGLNLAQFTFVVVVVATIVVAVLVVVLLFFALGASKIKPNAPAN